MQQFSNAIKVVCFLEKIICEYINGENVQWTWAHLTTRIISSQKMITTGTLGPAYNKQFDAQNVLVVAGSSL